MNKYFTKGHIRFLRNKNRIDAVGGIGGSLVGGGFVLAVIAVVAAVIAVIHLTVQVRCVRGLLVVPFVEVAHKSCNKITP